MPDFFLSYGVEEKQYDRYEFMVTRGGRTETVPVEGHLFHYHYYFDETKGACPSKLQIVRNYQNAARKVSGQVLYEKVDQRNQEVTTLLVAKDGREFWVYVDPKNEGRDYHLWIVEREAMRQDVVADAAALESGLAESGHVEIPGIFFDTGKADVKPESEPALREIEKLLKANPSLKVWVVGHTDSTGSLQTNLTLSAARAAAVAKVLTERMGVEATRLAPFGAGPYAPVASNRTEEGRGRNRRVELVER